MQRTAITTLAACVMLAASTIVPNQARAFVAPENNEAATPITPDRSDEIDLDDAPPAELGNSAMAEMRSASMEEVCATLAAAAAEYELPLAFFARLIWQESRFRSDAVSRVGARGIAQFMPGTAVWRGLSDPHDPIESLRESAEYLRDLRAQFGGNLGLAAAAYNGGSGRVQAWLNGRGGLPPETRQYVQVITGVGVDEWRARRDVVYMTRLPKRIPCPVLVALAPDAEPAPVVRVAAESASPALRASMHVMRVPMHMSRTPETVARMRIAQPGASAPHARRESGAGWSVVLASNFSQAGMQEQWSKLQRRLKSVLAGREPKIVSRRVAGRGKALMAEMRIAENDRVSAERLCAKLRASGASCVVTRTS